MSFAGVTDEWGNDLVVTELAIADELASLAELASGKLGGRPLTIVRGAPAQWFTPDDGPGARALIRADDADLFGLGARQAVITALLRDQRRGFDRGGDDLAVFDDVLGATPIHAVRVGAIISIDDRENLREAGALGERITALAFAEGVTVEIRWASEVSHSDS